MRALTKEEFARRQNDPQKLARDEAIDEVRRKLYERAYVDRPSNQVWKARDEGAPATLHAPQRLHPATLPAELGAAQKFAQARLRLIVFDTQMAQTIAWLHDQGIDCRLGKFDQEEFDRWFAETFPRVLPPAERRREVAQELWVAGWRPGRGGNKRWNQVHSIMQEKYKTQCTLVTVQKDWRLVASENSKNT
jgi:hypothetical protein